MNGVEEEIYDDEEKAAYEEAKEIDDKQRYRDWKEEERRPY